MTLHTTFLSQQEEFEKKFTTYTLKANTEEASLTRFIHVDVTPDDIKSFHKQSFLKFIEAVEGEIGKKLYDMNSKFHSEEAEVEATIYNEALNDLLSLLASSKKEIEKEL